MCFTSDYPRPKLIHLHARVVERRVEHDDREGEDVAGVRIRKNIRIQLTITLREALHHSVNFLCLTG